MEGWRGAGSSVVTRAMAGAFAVAVLLGGCSSGGSKRLSAGGTSTTGTGSGTSTSPGDSLEPGPSLPSLTTALPNTTSSTSGEPNRSSTTSRVGGPSSTSPPRAPSTTSARSDTSTTRAAQTSTSTSTTKAPAGSGAISIRNFTFSPNPLRVAPGTRVVTTNREDASTGSATHTWTSDTGQWTSGDLAPGASFAFVFSTPGTFSYHCNIHASMHGTVIVG